MTVRQRSHLAESHFARAFVLIQDQNYLCEDLSMTTERYRDEVKEYKKKVDELTYLADYLEAEVERLTILGRRSGLERRRAWRSQLKVESQDLALAEMVAKVETLEKALLNFRDSDEEKKIFEDGKHVGGMELLALIKDQHHDFNFGSLFREGEIVALALPIVDIEAEVPEPSVPSEVNTSDLPAASEAKTSDPPAQGTDLSVFEKFARLVEKILLFVYVIFVIVSSSMKISFQVSFLILSLSITTDRHNSSIMVHNISFKRLKHQLS
ncbi:hypothetical protein Fot_14367 [Forsythia ovata]|uniref:Uncharacterized protein n=1 Tax=Forsythia ovata TaxID=205694 RepID=A0ABD1W662_9LAMI